MFGDGRQASIVSPSTQWLNSRNYRSLLGLPNMNNQTRAKRGRRHGQHLLRESHALGEGEHIVIEYILFVPLQVR